MKLRDRLRLVLEERHLQQKQVAAAMGCTATHVSDLLTGNRAFSPARLSKFLDAAGVTLPGARRDFHRHGAREAGWEIDPPD